MLTEEEFRKKYPREKIENLLPDRPISSVRDIQHFYGRLYTLGTAGGGDYADYLTPDEAGELMDEEESLIVVRVDLTGENPVLDQEDPVRIRKYQKKHIEKVAHAKYEAARGIDHSITHQSGKKSTPEKLARYAKERLTKWPNDEHVIQTSENHAEGWIVESLRELGGQDEVQQTIENCIERKLAGKTTALLTIRVKIEEQGAYFWPGEVEVINECMRQRKISKLTSKGKATDSSGETTGLIQHQTVKAVGTAEDPMNYFLGKQLEKFPGLDPDEAWRSHPVSEDSAVTIMNAKTFSEACTYSTYGATIYYLPYFRGRITPDEAYMLYGLLSEAKRRSESEDSGGMTPIEQAYNKIGHENVKQQDDRLRFYLSMVMKHQMARFDVFADTLNARLIYPVSLAESHREILHSWCFNQQTSLQNKMSSPLPVEDDWALLDRVGTNFLGIITTGLYFYETFPEGDSDRDASADDDRIGALASVLAGDTIPVSRLLRNYVRRLIDEEGGDYFPSYLISSQFAQICSLARSGFLTSNREELDPITVEPDYSFTIMNKSEKVEEEALSRAALREQKLEAFLDGTPAFKNPERRGSFLVGTLVGQIGGFQQSSENRSTTVVDQYPIKSVTKNRIKKITQEVLDKNVVYSRDKNMNSTMYAEVVDRLVDTLTSSPNEPEDWEIRTDDLRFYYALGVTYGLNNWVSSEK